MFHVSSALLTRLLALCDRETSPSAPPGAADDTQVAGVCVSIARFGSSFVCVHIVRLNVALDTFIALAGAGSSLFLLGLFFSREPNVLPRSSHSWNNSK